MAKGDLTFGIDVDVDLSKINKLIGEVSKGVPGAAKELNDALSGQVKKQLVIETITDERGVRRLVATQKEVLTAADAIANKQAQINRLQEGSLTSLRQQVNQAKQARDEIAKYRQEVGPLGNQVRIVTDQWAAQNAKVQRLQRELNLAGASNFWDRAKAELNAGGLISFANGLTQITNGLQSASIVIGQVIGSFNNLTTALAKIQQFQLSFKAIGATQAETSQAFDDATRIALGLGVSIQTVRDAFQQLSPTVLTSGGTMNDVASITEALSSRFVAFGLSADQSRRVMNGVIQAFGKGKLMAEELTQQISEADPAFRSNFASALGVSVKQLNELVKAGEITNDVLLETLPKLSKSALLFGNLGESGLSAAAALRSGSATFEQFRNQLANLAELNLQKLSTIFKPLLFAISEVQGSVTDLITTLVNSQSFKTFAEFVNSLATQFSFVSRAAGAFLKVLFDVVNIVAAVINSIDSLLAPLLKFRPIVTLLATLITAKLVAALALLTSKGIVGAVVAGMGLAARATAAFSAGGIMPLTRSLGASLASFAGFKKATLDQIRDNFAAVGSLRARAAAQAQLAAAQNASTGGNLQLLAQAAGQRAAAKAAQQAAAANIGLAGATTAAGVAGAGAATGIGSAGAAAGAAGAGAAAAAGRFALLGKAAGFLLNPWTLLIGTAIALSIAFGNSGKETQKAADEYERFKTSFDGIKERADKAIEAIQQGGTSSSEFRDRLNELQVSAKKGVKIVVNWREFQERASQITRDVAGVYAQAAIAANKYDAQADKTGRTGEQVAIRLAAAETTVQEALDTTRATRDKLLSKITAAGGTISEANKKELSEYQRKIEALERTQAKVAELKKEAAKKGVPIDLGVDEGLKKIETIKERIKTLQGEIILEVDPQKFAETQGRINGLAARLAFLQADRVQIKIDLEYNINKQSLDNQLNLARATADVIKSQVDLSSALNDLAVARIGFQETERSEALRLLQERLQGEKEIRDERIEELQEAGASEALIKKLKEESRIADKKAAQEIKAEEEKIRDIQKQKRDQEAAGIQQRLNSLPTIQEAERRSLNIAQQLRRLEQERLLFAQKRLAAEGAKELADLERKRLDAVNKGDFEKAENIQKEIDLQREYLGNLDKELKSIQDIISATQELDQLEQTTLTNQQKATQESLKAQAAAYGQAAAAGQAAQATQQTAQAWQGVGSNAEAFRQLTQQAAEWSKRGAESADKTSQATQDAAQAAQGTADGAQAASDASASAQQNLGQGATEASAIETNLTGAAEQARQIASAITGLDGLTVNVNVNGIPGLWTGGPTAAGQTYQVNELGQEGFLSAGGRLSAINRPKNALWRAPSSGTVIPAHIWSGLDVPRGGVSTTARPMAASGGGNGLQRVVRAIQASLGSPASNNAAMHEMASVQARQAIEIGKLSRAVNKLADKDHTVNVAVRNTGSTAYLDALNRRM